MEPRNGTVEGSDKLPLLFHCIPAVFLTRISPVWYGSPLCTAGRWSCIKIWCSGTWRRHGTPRRDQPPVRLRSKPPDLQRSGRHLMKVHCQKESHQVSKMWCTEISSFRFRLRHAYVEKIPGSPRNTYSRSGRAWEWGYCKSSLW